MSETLSILLPVHNAEDRLREQVEQIIDNASEMTNHFELIVLDDGSSDMTAEVADDMARRYPQVSYMRRGVRGGLKRLVAMGLDQCRGEVVMVHDGVGLAQPHGFRALWSRRDDPNLVMARNTGARGWYMLRRNSIPSMTPKERMLAVDHEIRIIRADLIKGKRHVAPRPALYSQLKQLSAGD